MFRNRVDAGRRLAQVLQASGLGGDGTVVLGLPRGGVPVAAEVGGRWPHPSTSSSCESWVLRSSPSWRWGPSERTGYEWRTRRSSDRAASAPPSSRRLHGGSVLSSIGGLCAIGKAAPASISQGRCAVIVDDGIATGSTARAACRVARAHGASRIVLAVPVAPTTTVSAVQDVCDDMLCVAQPDPFFAVGEWYRDFTPTSDEEVVELLRRAQL